MNVRVEASMKNGRGISVELNDQDGQESFDTWGELPVTKKFQKLSAKADSLVVLYLAQNHDLSQDEAKQRLLLLKTRMDA